MNHIVEKLVDYYKDNKLAHVYLIETSDVNCAFDDLKPLFKCLFCNNEYKDNCVECNICHMIENDSLSSLKVVEQSGNSIKKDDIEDLKHFMSNMPIYTKNNVYVVKNAEKMNAVAFNRLLKFIEEPNSNIYGFFITTNKDLMPETIVSRCQVLKFNYKNSFEDEAILNDVDLFVKECDKRVTDTMCYNMLDILKKYEERSQITIFLNSLLNKYLVLNRENNNYYRKVKVIVKYLEQLNYNVNLLLFCESFVIEFMDV